MKTLNRATRRSALLGALLAVATAAVVAHGAVKPLHGGVLGETASHNPVELVRTEGELIAYLSDATGKPVPAQGAQLEATLHGGRGQQDGGQCPGACRHQGRASPDAAGPGGGAVARDAQVAAASRQVGCLGGRPPETAGRRQGWFAEWRAPPKPLARRRT